MKNNRTLFDDCKEGYFDGVKDKINKINNRSDMDMIYNDNNETPLWISCSEGHLEIVEFLIAKGALVNQANNNSSDNSSDSSSDSSDSST